MVLSGILIIPWIRSKLATGKAITTVLSLWDGPISVSLDLMRITKDGSILPYQEGKLRPSGELGGLALGNMDRPLQEDICLHASTSGLSSAP